MQKSNLRTGMWVKYRDGQYAIVLRDTKNGDLFADDGFMDFDSYTEDLKVARTLEPTDYDIMEVWQPKGCRCYYKFQESVSTLLWKRNSPRTLAFAEAEKILADHLGQNVVIKAG